jgi:hypothetical protein
VKSLGKLLFPKRPRDERRRRLRTLCVAIVLGIISAGITVGLLLLAYHSARFRR